MVSLEDRDNPTAWKALLDRALPALDHALGRDSFASGQPSWSLGGGTAIALRIAHRLSDDIDLFVPTVPLKVFTPRENPGAAGLGCRFQWPGHDMKYECQDGEVDFLSAHLQTAPGYTVETFRGRPVPLETLDEVIVKKLRFRGARFTARDAFDLAAVQRAHPAVVRTVAEETGDILPRLRAMIVAMAAKAPAASLRPAAGFADIAARPYDAALAVVDEAIRGLGTKQRAF